MKMKKTLWTKDFSLITVTTVLSAIAGEALVLPVSLLVFDETQSTLLSSIIMICSFLPDLLFGVLVSPAIDRGSKKHWVIALDIASAAMMVAMGLLMLKISFSYWIYVIFTFVFSTASALYQVSFGAWFPNLIPVGFEQKGYAVSSTIYPVITLSMAPLSAFLYTKVPISWMFLVAAALLVLSIVLESMIGNSCKSQGGIQSLKEYIKELKSGFAYFKKEKGMRNISGYMGITNGISVGESLMQQAYFQTSAVLNATMFGFLTTAEMIGRVIGGVMQYFIKVPAKKRFAFTKTVYICYDSFEAFLLYLPYPVMLGIRFILGSLGVQSATIRQAAVQSYIPPEMRGRINAILSGICSLGMIIVQVAAGMLGEVMPYRTAALLLGGVNFLAVVALIIIPAKVNRPVYEAERASGEV
jgi:DHA3 family macrolide efflux protein-like MFS transporter